MKSTKNQVANSRTAPRAHRRQQLIDATIEVIAENGLAKTTLAMVTKRAGLSQGIVNFHFDSKEDLYDQTLGYLAQEHYNCWHDALVSAGADPARQLAAIVDSDFREFICTPDKLAVWFAFWAQPKYRPSYLLAHNKYDEERIAEITRLCREIATAGGYDRLDVEQAARWIEAMIDGMWLSRLLYADEKEPGDLRNDCHALLARLFPDHFPLPSMKPDCQLYS